MLSIVHGQERFKTARTVLSAFVRQWAAVVVGQHCDVMFMLKSVGALPAENGVW